MIPLQEGLKRVTPAPVWDAARITWYGLYRLSLWPGARFHPWRRQSIRYLAAIKDIHKGERCFIIGNGPSLKQTDLTRLKDELTFGMNRFYLAFPELGFPTTYFVAVNDLVIEQCIEDIYHIPAPKFLSWRSRKALQSILPSENELPNDPPLAFLHTTYTGPKFAQDASTRLWEGATVTYVTLQLAFHMGFQKVILIGIDHSFTSKGKPNTTVVSRGDDQDHFDAKYFGKGFRWQLPDLETSERAYRIARTVFEEAGRQVIDATVGGKLAVFPKVSYDSLF